MSLVEKTIKRWNSLLNATNPEEISLSADNCPLCQEYFNEDGPEYKHCLGCPVSEKVGTHSCTNTFYITAQVAHNLWLKYPEDTAARRTFHWAARSVLWLLREIEKDAHISSEG